MQSLNENDKRLQLGTIFLKKSSIEIPKVAQRQRSDASKAS